MNRLFSLFVMLCLLSSAPLTGQATTGSGQDLLLFYSSDVAGETEPCG